MTIFANSPGAIFTWDATTVTSGHCLLPGTRSNATGVSDEDFAVFFCPRAGRARRLIAYSSGSMTVTVRKNKADTTITCAPNNTTATDLTHEVNFASGDTLSIKITGTAGAQALVALEFA